MYERFRKFDLKWLKEHSKAPDCIDEWLLGEETAAGSQQQQTKTVCLREAHLKKPPYHVFYRYKVVPVNAAASIVVGSKKNGTKPDAVATTTTTTAVNKKEEPIAVKPASVETRASPLLETAAEAETNATATTTTTSTSTTIIET